MIKIVNLSSEEINEDLIRRAVKITLKEEESKMSPSIAIVDSEEIKKLNFQYRKLDKPTDVLSFGEDINEIVICPEEVKKNGNDFNKELKKVVIHGTLHLLGYDHETNENEAKEMLNKQNKYLKIN
ncbi:MAG: putative rRNA maturation factor [Patescibacteria group bacterium]|nr:putative rRNA maturation factor [Patescibacteria group bacterium]